MRSIVANWRIEKQWPAAGIALLGLALQSCGGSDHMASATMPAPTPTVTLSVNPTTITAGQTATLSWSSMNATSFTASRACSGEEAPSGSMAVTPTTTGMYTLTCTGPSGGIYSGGGGLTANQTATLTV